jgi:phage terminase large subunit-like protein
VTFELTPKQAEALAVASGPASHIMFEGGGRSGKTFLHVRNTIMRAVKAPGSKHLIARYRFNHLHASVIADTFPKVMQCCFPGIGFDLSKSHWYAEYFNGAQIWFAGLDDKERTEKVLGQEFATVYLNECSQTPWESRNMIITRLAQKVMQEVEGAPPVPLKLRAFYDCNPPNKAHWTFRVFHQGLDPETHEPLPHPERYARVLMNPRDNAANISSEYLEFLAGLSPRMRRRFEHGQYAEAAVNALFDESTIDKWRVLDGKLPDFVRVVVAVDPSGSGDEDNADNDEIGIVIGALGTDGNAYLLEDCSIKAGPATWGKVSTDAYVRHEADCIVGEGNFGGDMVRATIHTARKNTNFKKVTASRGKVVRAEPFSALYEQGKVRHVGIMAKLEDELCAFTTNGYQGARSPNRADAAIWVLAELFPAIVAGPKVEKPKRERVARGQGAWMG